jgi:hypothetical protein
MNNIYYTYDYTQRHNNVPKLVHQQMAKDTKLLNTDGPYNNYQAAELLKNTSSYFPGT